MDQNWWHLVEVIVAYVINEILLRLNKEAIKGVFSVPIIIAISVIC